MKWNWSPFCRSLQIRAKASGGLFDGHNYRDQQVPLPFCSSGNHHRHGIRNRLKKEKRKKLAVVSSDRQVEQARMLLMQK
jgi:hypothetical protein